MAINYPVTAFHFSVEWGGTRIGFTEVSGLTMELQSIDYREGNSGEYQVKKMPGIPQFGNVTLKRGIFSGDNEFADWLGTVRMNQIERRDLTINLLNEDHDPIASWSVKNCFPVKVEAPALNSTGNEVAIESIELAHEGLTLSM